jgi:hypothetical protein
LNCGPGEALLELANLISSHEARMRHAWAYFFFSFRRLHGMTSALPQEGLILAEAE